MLVAVRVLGLPYGRQRWDALAAGDRGAAAGGGGVGVVDGTQGEPALAGRLVLIGGAGPVRAGRLGAVQHGGAELDAVAGGGVCD